jgi:hypothetical protein
MNIVNVPPIFQQPIGVEYPKGNWEIFEQWLIHNVGTFESNRWYLPVNWCGFYVNNKYGKNRNAMAALDRFLRTLDRSKKYWTVTQYDLGIISNINGLDIKIFGAGGGRIDFPIPLLCKTEWVPDVAVSVESLVSFFGAATHPIRKKMLKYCPPEWDVQITNNIPHEEYRARMEKSTFSLCPRGFGPTSFRICEALQCGSIPVYISDNFVFPGNFDFFKYGLIVKEADLPNLEEIIHDVTIGEESYMSTWGRRLTSPRGMFTYEGCRNLIISNL